MLVMRHVTWPNVALPWPLRDPLRSASGWVKPKAAARRGAQAPASRAPDRCTACDTVTRGGAGRGHGSYRKQAQQRLAITIRASQLLKGDAISGTLVAVGRCYHGPRRN